MLRVSIPHSTYMFVIRFIIYTPRKRVNGTSQKLAAWPSVRSVFLRRPCSQGRWFNSHPSLVVASLDKMLHNHYLCGMECSKQQIKEVRSKTQVENSETKQLLSESGFVLCIAPLLLSRDRRIKMKK